MPEYREATPYLRSLLGTLFFLPMLVVLFGSTWKIPRIHPISAPHVLDAEYADTAMEEQGKRVLQYFPEGSRVGRVKPIPAGGVMQVELESLPELLSLSLQGTPDAIFKVCLIENDGSCREIWRASRVDSLGGLRTRVSPLFRVDPRSAPAILQISLADSPAREFTVAGFSVYREPIVIPHWMVAGTLWLVYLLLAWGRRISRLSALCAGLLAGWARIDFPLTVILSCFLMFSIPAVIIIAAGIVGLIAVLVCAVKRYPIQTGSALLVISIGFGFLLPSALKIWTVAQLSRQHSISVDHRLLPNTSPEINGDGIRFLGKADDVSADSFNVLFLGDSFTFGDGLLYKQSFPYRFESLASERQCTQKIRAINFGWTSSSPLLSLRLLREIGQKYKPDLVVYNLDMTDFSDDLEYEHILRESGDYEIDPGRILEQHLRRFLPHLLDSAHSLSGLQRYIRILQDDSKAEQGLYYADPRVSLPEACHSRFFASRCPLEQTKDAIKNGVEKNLFEMNSYVRHALGVPFVVNFFPRHYQHSDREVPRNWEAAEYEVLGPYVKEPFNYFQQKEQELPFPMLLALHAFEKSTSFPLYLNDDPHWNAEGAEFMASTLGHYLSERALIPCSRW